MGAVRQHNIQFLGKKKSSVAESTVDKSLQENETNLENLENTENRFVSLSLLHLPTLSRKKSLK